MRETDPSRPNSNVQIATLGRYRLLRKLGVGGSATVYLAQDTTIDKQVALKVLHENLQNDPVTVRRFVNDARTLARLNHPNIVQVYSAELEQYYFAMELIEGSDLAAIISQQGALEPTRAAGIARQIASALAHIHGAGMVHRDVKPGNIMVAPGDCVKLADFSVVRGTEETVLTVKGSLVGTYEYMAPEQIREEELDARTDVYALGVVLYEMLVGRPPFPRDAPGSDIWPLLQRIQTEPPKPIGEINPSIPPALARATMKALEKDPAMRFPTMAELYNALDISAGDATTRRAAAVALAAPVEADGNLLLSWTQSEDADFVFYEIHASGRPDFVPSFETRMETVRNRESTQIAVPSPKEPGSYYYRIKTVIRDGVPNISNRTMFRSGQASASRASWKSPTIAALISAVLVGTLAYIYQSRHSSISGAVNATHPSDSGLVASSGAGDLGGRNVPAREPDRVRVSGRFSSARYLISSRQYRFELEDASMEVIETGPLLSGMDRTEFASIRVEIPRAVSDSIDASGIDLTLLPSQDVTVVGMMRDVPDRGLMVTPDDPRQVGFQTWEPLVRDISPRRWKEHENEIVRLHGTVSRSFLVGESKTGKLVLDPGDVMVVAFNSVVGAMEERGIRFLDLDGSRIVVIGRVVDDPRFQWQIVVSRPQHITLE